MAKGIGEKYDVFDGDTCILQNASRKEIREQIGVSNVAGYTKQNWLYKHRFRICVSRESPANLDAQRYEAVRDRFSKEMFLEWLVLNARYGSRFRKKEEPGQCPAK